MPENYFITCRQRRLRMGETAQHHKESGPAIVISETGDTLCEVASKASVVYLPEFKVETMTGTLGDAAKRLQTVIRTNCQALRTAAWDRGPFKLVIDLRLTPTFYALQGTFGVPIPSRACISTVLGMGLIPVRDWSGPKTFRAEGPDVEFVGSDLPLVMTNAVLLDNMRAALEL